VHSKYIRFFDIAQDSIVIGEALTHCQGILSGQPVLMAERNPANPLP